MKPSPNTVKDAVDDPEPGAAMDVGLRLTFTNDGWPDADKAIAELKPPEATVVIVAVVPLPGATESVPTDGLMLKLPTTAAVTVRVKVVV